MDELIAELSAAARGMWKHRWLGLVVAWIATGVGGAIVWSMPDKYEASARIFVDTQSILKPLMSGLAVQPNVDQQVTMLSRTLISRPNVEKLIRMADLDLKIKTKAEQDGLIDKLLKTLEIKNLGRDNLYVLSYRDSSPEKAKKVVQSLVSIFIESSLGDSRKDSSAARRFIDEQIKTYLVKLETAEARLKEFKVRNIEIQSGDGKGMTEKLSAVNEQLNQARLDLHEAENARNSAKRQLDDEKNQNSDQISRGLLQESTLLLSTPEIDGRIETQRRNLDGLLQRFTEQHPDVVSTRRLIKELEEVRRKELIELKKSAINNPPLASKNNLVYQEINRLFVAAELQVASLKARVGEYESRFTRARELMKTSPQIEAELTQLNRDYEINTKKYNELVTRRESASLTGEIESATGLADFRLIDPPRAEQAPVAPNRLLIMPLVLLFAMSVGLAITYVASLLRGVFHDARTLKNTFDLPLLGVVTFVKNEGDVLNERADLRRFLGGFVLLVLVFTAGMSVMYLKSGAPA
jgi:polysaccharide chain length determinant protein (PEP-CTERM system associated)